MRQNSAVILQATPGSGKTTRVPPALLNCVQGKIVVLEPRRLAARLSAERVAFERGESVGQSVGFRIRFQAVESSATRLTFVTEGLLLRQLINDPTLHGVGCVILDEFHERHLHGDIALAMLRLLQRKFRPDLKIVVMSATLDCSELTRYFGDAEVVTQESRKFPLTVAYQPGKREVSFSEQVGGAVEEVLASATGQGNVLVFLPGAAEIRKSAERLAGVSSRYDAVVMELRGETNTADQARIFAPRPAGDRRRKIILATNVAETSITIDGVDVVIDTGVAKIPGYAPWSGLPTLELRRVSQASCIQRAGRAARTGPGHVIRLFSEADFLGRAPFEKPEIVRLDLAQMILESKSMLSRLQPRSEWDELSFVDAPPPDRIASARLLLQWLGALDREGQITDCGQKMAALPLHPRMAKLVVHESAIRDTGMDSISRVVPWIAAVLGETSAGIFREPAGSPSDSDVVRALERLAAVTGREAIAAEARRIEESANQIARLSLKTPDLVLRKDLGRLSEKMKDRIGHLLLTGFPDRVAKKRPKPSGSASGSKASGKDRHEYNLCLGGGTVLGGSSGAWQHEWIICLDGEESLTGGAAQSVITRTAVGIDPLALLDGPEEFVSENRTHIWDKSAERVRCYDRVCYGNLIVEETQAKIDSKVAEELLVAALKDRWPKPFEDTEALSQYRLRIQIAKKFHPTMDFPTLEGDEFELLLAHMATAKTSFAEVAETSLEDYIGEQLDEQSRSVLRSCTPTYVTIGSGRKVKVTYDGDKPPWVASRLQDFFGTLQTPAIAEGRLPLTVHLLAPNRRAVQVTQDLGSFWRNSYPALRRELSRNYPRHAWPEDPLTADPPPLHRLR